jgi:hypothetical protein
VKNTLERLKRRSHAVEVFTLYGGGWGGGVGGGGTWFGRRPWTDGNITQGKPFTASNWVVVYEKDLYQECGTPFFYLHIAVCFSKIYKKVYKIINR